MYTSISPSPNYPASLKIELPEPGGMNTLNLLSPSESTLNYTFY